MFDYLSIALSTADVEALEKHTLSIQGNIRRIGQNVVAIGWELKQVRQILDFTSWVLWAYEEFGLQERTAQRWVQSVELLETNHMLSYFLEGYADFDRTALYALSGPAVTTEVRNEVFSRVLGGEKLTGLLVANVATVFSNTVINADQAVTRSDALRELTARHPSTPPETFELLEQMEEEDPDFVEDLFYSDMVTTAEGDEIPFPEVGTNELRRAVNAHLHERDRAAEVSKAEITLVVFDLKRRFLDITFYTRKDFQLVHPIYFAEFQQILLSDDFVYCLEDTAERVVFASSYNNTAYTYYKPKS